MAGRTREKQNSRANKRGREKPTPEERPHHDDDVEDNQIDENSKEGLVEPSAKRGRGNDFAKDVRPNHEKEIILQVAGGKTGIGVYVIMIIAGELLFVFSQLSCSWQFSSLLAW